MTDTQKLQLVMRYSDRILELAEDQRRGDEDSMTQSDLQGATEAIVLSIIFEIEKGTK